MIINQVGMGGNGKVVKITEPVTVTAEGTFTETQGTIPNTKMRPFKYSEYPAVDYYIGSAKADVTIPFEYGVYDVASGSSSTSSSGWTPSASLRSALSRAISEWLVDSGISTMFGETTVTLKMLIWPHNKLAKPTSGEYYPYSESKYNAIAVVSPDSVYVALDETIYSKTLFSLSKATFSATILQLYLDS